MADNILTYTLSLQDNISGKLKNIGINNEKQLDTWSKVQQKVNSASESMTKMGRCIGSMNERIAALKAQKEWIPASNRAAIRATNHEIQRLEKEIRKLDNLDGGRLKKWFGDIKNSIPAFVNPITAAVAGIGSSLKVGMENELQKQNITSLMGGDANAADELFGKISEYGKNTVYDKAGLINAQKTMMSFGLEANKSFSVLKQIGDIAMGDANKMQSLALAFSQATSAGKLQGQDLMQLINAGFNPLQVISEKTGESMSSLKDRMSKGEISAGMLAQAFQWATEAGGLFYQGAEKAGQTFSGKVNQMMDSLAEIGIAFYSAIEPIMSPLVDFATNILEVIGSGVTRLTNAIKEGNPVFTTLAVVSGAVASGLLAIKIQSMALTAAQKIQTAITGISTVTTLGWKAAMDALNMSFLANPIFWIVTAIAALIACIAIVISKTDGWRETWNNAMEYIKLSFGQCGAWLNKKWLQIEDSFMMGFENIKIGWYKLQSLWDSEAAEAGLQKIQASRDERARKIAEAQGKIDEFKETKDKIDVWQVEWKKKEDKQTEESSETALSGGMSSGLIGNVIPGTGGTTVLGNGGNGNMARTTEAIASGGTRNSTTNITIGKMADMVFNGGFKENAADIKSQFESLLLQVLYMAQNAG